MRAAYIFVFMVLSGAAFAADPMKIQISGFSTVTPSSPVDGDEWWMPYTKPLDISRYALTNDTLTRPIVVTILHYPSTQKAKEAFRASSGGRQQAPKKLEVTHWDAAHRWTDVGISRSTDIYLLQGYYLVGVYGLPSDFSDNKLQRLLDALASCITEANASNAVSRSRL